MGERRWILRVGCSRIVDAREGVTEGVWSGECGDTGETSGGEREERDTGQE